MDTGRHPVQGLCVAVDVHYLRSGGAFSRVLAERTAVVCEVPRYRPGEFYRREPLPLRAVLAGAGGLGLLVVDGYADLDPAGRPGLGAQAHGELGVPVIGVAKSVFRTATHAIPCCAAGQRARCWSPPRDAPRRCGRAGTADGRPVQGTGRAAPRGRARPRRPAGSYPGESLPRLISAERGRSDASSASILTAWRIGLSCGRLALADAERVMGEEKRPPRILEISWGRMEVEGLGAGKDFKLYPGGGREWDWAETGTRHSPGIQPADVEELLARGAGIVVLSRGMHRRLQIAPATRDFLDQRSISVHVAETGEAVKIYNELAETVLVGGLFHSTC